MVRILYVLTCIYYVVKSEFYRIYAVISGSRLVETVATSTVFYSNEIFENCPKSA